MAENNCEDCCDILGACFHPSTPSSSTSLTACTHKAGTCSLLKLLNAGTEDSPVNEAKSHFLAAKGVQFDHWDDSKLPGVILASATPTPVDVDDASRVEVLQIVTSMHNFNRFDVSEKVAFSQAGSIWTDSPVWDNRKSISVEGLLPTIKRWMRECYTLPDHASCRDKPPRTKHLLPRRVIDVGPSDGSRAPYLLLTNGSYGSYVVLSHCWGTYQPFVTKKSTLESNMKYISMLSLPKTFRDAVYITRGLGIRYLWIDSLCIVQDDTADWESESANMIRIFQNATIALAATAATDSREGCCLRRRIRSLNMNIHKFPKTSTIYVRKVPTEVTLRQYILEAPLNQRAWVLQELLLSSRVVHFAQDQMYWQCSSRLTSEDGLLDQNFISNYTSPVPIEDGSNGELRLQSRVFRLVGNLTTKIEWWDQDISRDYWWTIVEEYSRRKLTRISDRLPALAGLTEFFQTRTGDFPVAGLWREDLLFGILWHVREPKKLGMPSSLPSWSWASIEGPIERCPVRKTVLPSGSQFENFRYVGYRASIGYSVVEWAGLPLVSQISRGELKLRGRFTWMIIMNDSGTKRSSVLNQPPTDQIERSSCWYFSGLKTTFRLSTEDETSNVAGIANFDYMKENIQGLILCLEISYSSPFRNSVASTQKESAFHEVLLLEAQEGGKFYRRIGAGIIFAEVSAFKGKRVDDFCIV